MQSSLFDGSSFFWKKQFKSTHREGFDFLGAIFFVLLARKSQVSLRDVTDKDITIAKLS